MGRLLNSMYPAIHLMTTSVVHADFFLIHLLLHSKQCSISWTFSLCFFQQPAGLLN